MVPLLKETAQQDDVGLLKECQSAVKRAKKNRNERKTTENLMETGDGELIV